MAEEERERTQHYLQRLNELADVEIESGRAIKFYIRAAEVVYKQACIYHSEGDLEKSYILYLKYANLVLRELPKHPEYREPSYAAALAALRANCLMALDLLEGQRPLLLERFRELERRAQREREEEAARLAQQERIEREARQAEQQRQQAQIEARRLRLREMQRLEMAKIYQESKNVTNQNVPSSTGSTSVRLDHSDIPSFSSSSSSVSPAKTPKYHLENGMHLRPVFIPHVILARFMELAAEKTRKNLETCGVLAGRLSHDTFTITTLIIPKQTATSDSVTMSNEEEVVAVQDAHDLLTLGWIHTHPTQQCFMSSVDLHTHYPYQLLMAEAIAIVVAPTQTPKLTDPPGLATIGHCPQRGFHLHPSGQQIYKELTNPEGHAKFANNLSLEIIDLR